MSRTRDIDLTFLCPVTVGRVVGRLAASGWTQATQGIRSLLRERCASGRGGTRRIGPHDRVRLYASDLRKLDYVVGSGTPRHDPSPRNA